jgi:hypothetical protein
MPVAGIIQAATLCAALQGSPRECLSSQHPSAQLFNVACTLPEITSVSPNWRAGTWRGQVICWRPDPGTNRVRVIAGNEPVQWVAVSSEQAQCIKVTCEPEQALQTGAHKGRKQ